MSDKSDKVKSETAKSAKSNSSAAKEPLEKIKPGNAQPGKEKPVQKSSAQNPAPKLSISLSHALLLMAVVLIGINVYLWNEVMQLKYTQQNILAKANKSSTDLVQHEMSKVDKRLQQIRQQTTESSKAAVQSLDKLGRSVNELQKITGREKQGWKLAESAFLLAVANHSVSLKHDIETALVALTEADQRLKEVNDPKYFDIRKKIAAEISQLKAIKRPDIDGMIVKLDSISKQTNSLALFASVPAELKKKNISTEKSDLVDADIKKSTAPEEVKLALKGIWKELKTLVVVHHYDKSVPKLLLPEQEVAIRQVLDLKLQQARITLLKGNENRYRVVLQTINMWLSEHFDTNDSQVKTTIQTIKGLLAQKVVVNMPDISGSLRQMRRFLNSNTRPENGKAKNVGNPDNAVSTADKGDKKL